MSLGSNNNSRFEKVMNNGRCRPAQEKLELSQSKSNFKVLYRSVHHLMLN